MGSGDYCANRGVRAASVLFRASVVNSCQLSTSLTAELSKNPFSR